MLNRVRLPCRDSLAGFHYLEFFERQVVGHLHIVIEFDDLIALSEAVEHDHVVGVDDVLDVELRVDLDVAIDDFATSEFSFGE